MGSAARPNGGTIARCGFSFRFRGAEAGGRQSPGAEAACRQRCLCSLRASSAGREGGGGPAAPSGELDPRSPLNFYRQLNRLRHGGSALRDGDEIFLDFDALNALVWIRRPASPSYANPPVVILCNFSDKPAAIALKPELARLHLRGSFLKTVLRSDGGMGAMDISPVHLPPYGVYVGELKF